MEEFFQKAFNQLRGFFEELSLMRKIGMILVFLTMITIMVMAIIWAGKTRFKILFTDMNKEDSTMVARMLEEKNISYQLSEDGKTIRVPQDQVQIWRLELAKKGVTFSGTVGYEVFDNQSFGTSTFVQKVNKQRALEGELVKTINYIKGIKRSRVHLSIPENSPFVAEKKSPQASVVLELIRGVVLTPDEIRGIGSLVSASVDGMRPKNVVILDSRGKKLSDNMGDRMTSDTANRLVLEGRLARQYESQIEEILGKVVGDGRVTAKVTVKMDFTESISTETTYDQENTAVLSEVSDSEKLVGTRPSPQGIPGARSNLPGEEPQPGIPETRNDVDKRTITKNYNVPSKVVQKKAPTAQVRMISAAVMIDGKEITELDDQGAPVMGGDGFPKKKYLPWSDEDLDNFKSIVASTVGINAARGDSLVIKNMKFAKEDLREIEELMRQRENREVIKHVIIYLAVGLIMVLFFLIVVRPFIQWVTENTIESVEDFLPKTIEELEKIQADQKLPGLEEALPQIEEKINPEKIEGNMLKEKIISLCEENPSKAAQVVHSMIHNGETERAIA